MRVIITGSRDADEKQVKDVLDRWWFTHARGPGTHKFTRDLVIVQGSCPTGADKAARDWAAAKKVKLETFEADWDLEGKAAGPIRNRRMAQAGAHLCIALPLREGESTGTWGCVRECVKAGIKVEIYGVERRSNTGA